VTVDTTWPSVGVVVPTRNRPEQLRTALASILAQDYAGELEVLVVFDGTDPDQSIESDRVRTMRNTRTPGLAGARNSGILAVDTELVAFCDDDDEWLPGKLTAQVACLLDAPGGDFVTCSVVVDYDGRPTARVAGAPVVTKDQLLRSRMSMLHSSTFLIRLKALLADIGLVDESIPGSQCEDWDLLLRAAGSHPILHVDEPLVRIAWSRASYFSRRWDTKIASLRWMLDRHPGIALDRKGSARVYGQLAFAHAAMGARRPALEWAGRALARQPWEPRALLATAVAMRLTTSDTVLDRLHRHGRGI
jgi:glycosyltransferase involved in cell wall biosynthesis